MKLWRKKIMTLACATCLTVGMGAVACADTIDLGYGQYATTNNGVSATAIDVVSTNPNFRTKEQNKAVNEANAEVRKKLSERMQEIYQVAIPPFNGNTVDGYSVYQLSGDSALGHHTAWLISYNLNKDFIDYSSDVSTQIVNSVMAEKQVGIITNNKPYSKSNAEEFITQLSLVNLDRNSLTPVMIEYNTAMQRNMNKQLNQAVIDNAILSPKEQQLTNEAIDVLKKIIPNFSVGATELSFSPYTSKFGTLERVSLGGSINYDGFMLPGALNLSILPQNEGISIQVLATEDTSQDYWTKQVETMFGMKALKGGNK